MFGHAATLGKDAVQVKTYLPRATQDDCWVTKTTSNSAIHLAENLKKLMEANPPINSQSALGRAAKVDQKTIERMLKCLNEPTLEKVEKVAKVFGLSAWQLITPNLDPRNHPMLAAESEALREMYKKILSTREAIEGVLAKEGNTRPSEL